MIDRADLRRRLDRCLWAAVVIAALVGPLVPALLVAAGADAPHSGPTAEESSAVLGGVQRLLHASEGPRSDAGGDALPAEAPPRATTALLRTESSVHARDLAGPSISPAASERRLL